MMMYCPIMLLRINRTEHPERIMVVGGHLDSWDLGDGSHDDGTGCVQSMEVLNILKTWATSQNTMCCVVYE
jgi:hypothetical protein